MQVDALERLEVCEVVVQVRQVVVRQVDQRQVPAVQHHRVYYRVERSSFQRPDLVVRKYQRRAHKVHFHDLLLLDYLYFFTHLARVVLNKYKYSFQEKRGYNVVLLLLRVWKELKCLMARYTGLSVDLCYFEE